MWKPASARRGSTSRYSKIELGQPLVISSGTAPESGDGRWMAWRRVPSTSAMIWGKALSRASAARQSNRSRQCSTTRRKNSGGAPLLHPASSTLSGQRACCKRWRRSASWSSGTAAVKVEIDILVSWLVETADSQFCRGTWQSTTVTRRLYAPARDVSRLKRTPMSVSGLDERMAASRQRFEAARRPLLDLRSARL